MCVTQLTPSSEVCTLTLECTAQVWCSSPLIQGILVGTSGLV